MQSGFKLAALTAGLLLAPSARADDIPGYNAQLICASLSDPAYQVQTYLKTSSKTDGIVVIGTVGADGTATILKLLAATLDVVVGDGFELTETWTTTTGLMLRADLTLASDLSHVVSNTSSMTDPADSLDLTLTCF